MALSLLVKGHLLFSAYGARCSPLATLIYMADVTRTELENGISDADAADTQLTEAKNLLNDSAAKLAGVNDLLVRVREQLFPGTPPVEPPPPSGNFTTQNGLIYGPTGTVFTPKGINGYGANSYVWNAADFALTGQANKDRLVALGINAVRLVYCTTCVSHGPGSNNYGSLDDLITLYTTGTNKVVVLIDNHEGVLGATNGPTTAERNLAISRFAGWADDYKDNPYVWFGTYNEPIEEGWGVPANTTNWLNLQRPVLTAIRNAGNTNIVACCASHFGQDRGSFTNDINAMKADSVLYQGMPTLRQEFGNVIGEVHTYERWGGATTDATMDAYFDGLKDLGVPMIVGELGSWSADSFDEEGASARLYRVAARGIGIFPWMAGDMDLDGPTDLFGMHKEWIATIDTKATGGSGGTTQPPAVRPFVSNVVVTPGDTQLVLNWTNPALTGVANMTIAWGGPSGFINAVTFPVSQVPSTFTITGLTNGVTYSIDIGFMMSGETSIPHPSGFTRVNGTPNGTGGGTVPPPPSGSWPTNGTWNEKAAWVKSVAGCKKPDNELTVISSTQRTIPAGIQANWDDGYGGIVVTGPATIRNLDVRGLIVIRAGAEGVAIEDCKFRFLWSATGKVSAVRRCTVTINNSFNSGQGALNAQRAGTVIERCDISGAFDGMQWGGGGTVTECYIHDLTTTATSHNDWIQNYSQQIRVYRSYFFTENAPANHYNGVFSSNDSSASFYCEDCMFTHINPQGAAWACHANTSTIQLVRCRTSGGLIGNVVYGSDTVTTPLTTKLA